MAYLFQITAQLRAFLSFPFILFFIFFSFLLYSFYSFFFNLPRGLSWWVFFVKCTEGFPIFLTEPDHLLRPSSIPNTRRRHRRLQVSDGADPNRDAPDQGTPVSSCPSPEATLCAHRLHMAERIDTAVTTHRRRPPLIASGRPTSVTLASSVSGSNSQRPSSDHPFIH